MTIPANRAAPVTPPGFASRVPKLLVTGFGVLLASAAIATPSGPAPQAERPNTSTRYVVNCNNSGAGSLRDVVAGADNGDTVDLSALSCSTISLNGALIIEQDDLTLLGKLTPAYHPGITIRSAGPSRTIHHQGSGTLELRRIVVKDGTVNTNGRGACIRSAGRVSLYRTYVNNCVAKRAPGDTADAQGGGIYATLSVRLDDWSRVYDSKAIASEGNAEGGGIWAGTQVNLFANSAVYGNIIESSGRTLSGGGFYAGSTSRVEGDSRVDSNEARALGAGHEIMGVGIYSAGQVLLKDAWVRDNFTTYVPEEAPQLGGWGTGVYSGGLVQATRTEITGNHDRLSEGAGIHAKGRVIMNGSTVAGNYGSSTSGVYTKERANIANSTISGNLARRGPAVRIRGDSGGRFMIRTSTISGNEVTEFGSQRGAGVAVDVDGDIFDSTITANVERPLNAVEAFGAGLSLGQDVEVRLFNTIIAGNFHAITNGTYHWADIAQSRNQTGGSFASDSNYNLVGASSVYIPNIYFWEYDPKLGPLRNNGGLTRTHLPQADSPAVDAGGKLAGHPDSGLPDQRGVQRPWPGTQMDIGAVELTNIERDTIFWDNFDD